jgi:hypothetical protein
MSFRQFLRQHGSRLGATAMALGLASGATPALAVPIAVGTDISVAWDRPITGEPDLNATLDLTVESISASQIVLGVDIANTTDASFSSARLTGIGWQSTPLATGASDTSSIYSVFLNQNFPANPSVNLCLSSGSVCAGGGSGGLSPTQSDLSTLTLDGSFAGATIDFSNFAAKFQTDVGSFEPIGWITGICTTNCGGGGGGGGGGGVPEPGTLSIFGAALLASLGYALARARVRPAPVAAA